jgi:hypothetical protein
MYGTINITSDGALRIHTYTAPDDGWGVNSHIIELATQTIVIDAQYTLVYGRDVVDYANALAKPISRLYVDHLHAGRRDAAIRVHTTKPARPLRCPRTG